MSTTRIERHIAAPPEALYRALLDADAVQRHIQAALQDL